MKSDFTRKLLLWNLQENQRSMPWKAEKDPYKIWLSEIILQQTRVEQGLSYYNNFIRNFPTVHDLAHAPEDEVFKLWEGLGYYSRCKNLIHTAKVISVDYEGRFPETYDNIKALKGIGPYTASAIASFAFNAPYAVVDGNVQRVISRYFGISTPVDTGSGKKLYEQLAAGLLDQEQPALYNQAIMDFGAVICKPQNPLCQVCVQRTDCVAFLKGFTRQLPVKEKKLLRKNRWFYYFVIQTAGSVYVRKRPAKDIWENLHEFILLETSEPITFSDHPFLEELLGEQLHSVNRCTTVYKQQLTHQTINAQFILVVVPQKVATLSGYTLVDNRQLKTIAFPRIINRFLDENPISDTIC
jgi:A/G-specific adenine glycosylase